ncbi:MAG: hypothetical protein II230_07145 [Clostridia bacterium]|nr:hypothetical protein [Clostridia bacterium]
MDFVIHKDWFAQFVDGYEERTIRGEIYPDSTKSRYTNMDNYMNIRADVDSGIRKGDMLVDPNGVIYLLNWEVALQSNNAPSRALRCNMHLTVYRHQEEVVDEYGFEIEPEQDVVLVDRLPANAYRYDGRPEYTAVSGTPGMTPDALTIVSIQYNDKTKIIKENDKFIWANEEYMVVDINYTDINEMNNSGVMIIQAKKAPGGIL